VLAGQSLFVRQLESGENAGFNRILGTYGNLLCLDLRPSKSN
jgi:hypothetical protein